MDMVFWITRGVPSLVREFLRTAVLYSHSWAAMSSEAIRDVVSAPAGPFFAAIAAHGRGCKDYHLSGISCTERIQLLLEALLAQEVTLHSKRPLLKAAVLASIYTRPAGRFYVLSHICFWRIAAMCCRLCCRHLFVLDLTIAAPISSPTSQLGHVGSVDYNEHVYHVSGSESGATLLAAVPVMPPPMLMAIRETLSPAAAMLAMAVASVPGTARTYILAMLRPQLLVRSL